MYGPKGQKIIRKDYSRKIDSRKYSYIWSRRRQINTVFVRRKVSVRKIRNRIGVKMTLPDKMERKELSWCGCEK